MHHSSFLLILLLAFGQFAQALHQVEHVADHGADECQLCLQAQPADTHPPPTPASPLFVALPPTAPPCITKTAPTPPHRAWLARGPPPLR